jgi:hypothetical protein
MIHLSISRLSWALIASLVCLSAHAAPDKALDPKTLLNPQVCPILYVYNTTSGQCDPDVAKLSAAKEDDCHPANLVSFSNSKCVATQPSVAPGCQPLEGYTSHTAGTGVTATCTYEATQNSASSGDYLGDCFIIQAGVPSFPDLGPEERYIVTKQSGSPDNPRLSLVPADTWRWWLFKPFQSYVPGKGCAPTGTKAMPIQVPASALAESGAVRIGWVWGALSMPYKYYPGSKQFDAGLPIGAYLGWRIGQPGAGGTLAAAFTLGSVKARTIDPNIKDANGVAKITGDTTVAALSGAIGYVVDITRNVDKNPFKVGFFVGKDFVNGSDNILYTNNRKTWVALQIGYQFTDYR